MTVTVFTPTYNRAYSLPRLFQSLQSQTCRDFEWLILDDGSTDGTEDYVNKIKQDAGISLRYYKTGNGGKHRAINTGVNLAEGELFFIVDSDDFLNEDAVERIIYHFGNVRHDGNFAGVCCQRAYPDGERIGGEVGFEILDCSIIDFRQRLRIKGDVAEAFRTDVLKKYQFPDYAGERFCSEGLVFDKIGDHFKLRYFNEKLYVGEYLPDGLTCHKVSAFRGSPRYTMRYYKELVERPIPLIRRIRFAVNYWRFTITYKGERDGFRLPFWASMFYPAGLFFYITDSLKSTGRLKK